MRLSRIFNLKKNFSTNSGIEPEMVSEEVPESYTEFIEKVDNWIKTDSYVQQGLTIKELSKILYTNRTYLSAYIKTTYKMTFANG